MFRGPKPAGQPRTVRTIAEEKINRANMVGVVPERETQQTDPADAARPPTSSLRRGLNPTDPSPFQNLKG